MLISWYTKNVIIYTALFLISMVTVCVCLQRKLYKSDHWTKRMIVITDLMLQLNLLSAIRLGKLLRSRPAFEKMGTARSERPSQLPPHCYYQNQDVHPGVRREKSPPQIPAKESREWPAALVLVAVDLSDLSRMSHNDERRSRALHILHRPTHSISTPSRALVGQSNA